MVISDAMLTALGAALVSVVFIAAIATMISLRAARELRETPMVTLVKRRRELNAELRRLAGDSGEEIARLEAKRMGASVLSIEVLESAVSRAERISVRAEAQTDHPK